MDAQGWYRLPHDSPIGLVGVVIVDCAADVAMRPLLHAVVHMSCDAPMRGGGTRGCVDLSASEQIVEQRGDDVRSITPAGRPLWHLAS